MNSDDLHFYANASKGFVIILLVFIALFAAGFILGGLDRLPHAPVWEWGGMVLVGLALIVGIERIWRHVFLPQMSVTGSHLIVRPFAWITRKWAYADTTAWTVKTQRIETDWRGRHLVVPIAVDKLTRTDRTGRKTTVTLPGFSGENARLLQVLGERSGMDIAWASTDGANTT